MKRRLTRFLQSREMLATVRQLSDTAVHQLITTARAKKEPPRVFKDPKGRQWLVYDKTVDWRWK